MRVGASLRWSLWMVTAVQTNYIMLAHPHQVGARISLTSWLFGRICFHMTRLLHKDILFGVSRQVLIWVFSYVLGNRAVALSYAEGNRQASRHSLIHSSHSIYAILVYFLMSTSVSIRSYDVNYLQGIEASYLNFIKCNSYIAVSKTTSPWVGEHTL